MPASFARLAAAASASSPTVATSARVTIPTITASACGSSASTPRARVSPGGTDSAACAPSTRPLSRVTRPMAVSSAGSPEAVNACTTATGRSEMERNTVGRASGTGLCTAARLAEIHCGGSGGIVSGQTAPRAAGIALRSVETPASRARARASPAITAPAARNAETAQRHAHGAVPWTNPLAGRCSARAAQRRDHDRRACATARSSQLSRSRRRAAWMSAPNSRSVSAWVMCRRTSSWARRGPMPGRSGSR